VNNDTNVHVVCLWKEIVFSRSNYDLVFDLTKQLNGKWKE